MNPESLDEWYQERAAMIEYMGGYPREKAEALARAELESHKRAIEQTKEGARLAA